MQVQQLYDYTDMLKANLQSAITIGGKLQFKDDKQYQEFLDSGLIIGSLLVNTVSLLPVYNTSDNTIWDAVEAKVTLWGGNPQTDMNLRHLALVEILDELSAPDDILAQIEKVRVVAKFDVVDDTKIQFGDQVYVKADPYTSRLAETPFGNKVYRIYVDGTNGLDTNTGFDQDKPVKTIKQALSLLPIDLGGYGVYVIIKPGTYIMPRTVEFNNGFIDFMWYGKSLYEGSVEDTSGQIGFINYMNSDDPNLTDDQVIFINESETTNDAFYFKGKEMSYAFTAQNPGLNYNEVGKFYAERIVFKVNPDLPAKQYWTLIVFDRCNWWNEGQQQLFDATSCNSAVGFMWEATAFVRSIKIVANDVGGNTNTGQWRGAIVFSNNTSNITIEKITCGYAVGFEGVDGISITGFKQLLSNFDKYAENSKINFTGATISQGNLPTAEYQIYLSAQYRGQMIYNTTVATLLDNSIEPHIVKNESTTKTFVSSKIKQTTNNVIVGVLASVPTDSELSNKDLIFYMDETTDTLKVKYKDSGGVVQTGDIAILT